MIEIINCLQGSDDWYKARLGIVTTSRFQCLIANSADKKGRATYMRELAAERVTGERGESYESAAMRRGKEMEPEARQFYAFARNVDPEVVGFVRNGDKGCSPDAFIGKDGGLEIKTQQPDLLIETLFKDEFPPQHIAQTQGFLWITEREWVDLLVYWRGMPHFIKRAYRDVPYIAKLARAVNEFNEELGEMVEKIQAYGGMERTA